MKHEILSRRDLLFKCAALGALSAVPSLSLAASINRWEEQASGGTRTTAWDEIGPFYKRLAPQQTELRATGDPGLPLIISGQVWDAAGNILPGAKLEIWQTDHLGHYDLDGYRYRTTLVGDNAGKYSFGSVMPGHYPGRVCQHVHYLVSAPGHKPLITQLYFATDPVFEGAPDRNYTRDPLIQSRELVRPVALVSDPKGVRAAVDFQLVLERL